jgi:hypothetical protein
MGDAAGSRHRRRKLFPGVPGAASPDASSDLLVVAGRAREAREAADAQALASDAFLTEALDLLDAALDILADIRWSTRGPGVLAAGARAVARRQARLDAAALRLVGDVDAREDVVPRAKPKTAGAAFLRTALGLDRHRAGREADTARLVTGQRPDLAAVGAAYAAGQISRGHLDVAASVHRRLGKARETLMPVADPDTGQVSDRRTIEVVDAVLAGYARAFSVPELARIGDRLIEQLNPPSPDGAHQRRYLHLSPLADGSLYGTFFCGPAQALQLRAIVAALAAPSPGKAVDADGAAVACPMNAPGRNAASTPCSRPSATTPAPTTSPKPPATKPTTPPTAPTAPTAPIGTDGTDGTDGPGAESADGSGGGCGVTDSPADQNAPFDGHSNGGADETAKSRSRQEADRENLDNDLAQSQSARGDLAPFDEPPPEGEWDTRRPPGVRAGPYPDIDIILTATLDQLAHARALAALASGQPTLAAFDGAQGPDGSADISAAISGGGFGGGFGGGSGRGLAGFSGVFAHAQHGGPVHPTTLALLACNARIRRVVLDERGAVLHLGRAHRLATPAQKAALYARDIGCIIPGCTTSGHLCEIHHVIPWADAGSTDIDNLVLVCPRHHLDVTAGVWDVQMIHGLPWARPPAWAHPTRPLLRNASHQTPTAS